MGKRFQPEPRCSLRRCVLACCIAVALYLLLFRGNSAAADLDLTPVDDRPSQQAEQVSSETRLETLDQIVESATEPPYIQFVRSAVYDDVATCKEFHLKLKTYPVYSNMSCIDQSFPKKVFQTIKTYQVQNFSWVNNCSMRSVLTGLPDFEHHVYDDQASRLFVKQMYPEYYELYKGFGTNVERGDFWRYLTIYHYGGLYIDADCCIMKHLKDWIHPSKCRQEPVRVIVGIEAAVGRNPQRVSYPRLPTELCQWAFAAAPRHPFLQIVIRRIADFVRVEKEQNLTLDWYDAILNRTGPGVFTDAVEEYLQSFNATLADIGRGNKQIGDMFVLPADGFACRNGHSGARGCFNTNPGMCVKHLYANSWHKGRKKP